MARLTDVPHVYRTVGLFGFAKRLYNQINEDLLFTWAAALAYSWIFAIFPFLIFLLTLAPYLPLDAKDTVIKEMNELIDRSMPDQAANTLKQNVEKVMSEPRGGLLSIGLLITIWVASGGMAMTMSALDIAYDISKARSYIKQRLIAIALTIVVALMILSVMILLPIGTIVINWIVKQQSVFAPLLWVLNIARYALALVLLLTVLALIYYFGPSIRSKFHAITPGAVFAIAVWLILGFAFRFYINKFGRYDQTYGTVGGVAILLFFFYIDALVLLVGAEINSEIDFITIGLPSAADESPREAAAHAASEDEETELLARELKEKRKPDLSMPTLGARRASETPQTTPASAPRAAGINKWLLALSTLGVALLFDKLHQSHKGKTRQSEPRRLKQKYPATYATIRSRNGSKTEPTKM